MIDVQLNSRCMLFWNRYVTKGTLGVAPENRTTYSTSMASVGRSAKRDNGEVRDRKKSKWVAHRNKLSANRDTAPSATRGRDCCAAQHSLPS
jgi:hypothetical protein